MKVFHIFNNAMMHLKPFQETDKVSLYVILQFPVWEAIFYQMKVFHIFNNAMMHLKPFQETDKVSLYVILDSSL